MKLTPEMLRKIAQKYFDNPESINTLAGICYNLSMEFTFPNAYEHMSQIMDQMGYEDYSRFATEDEYQDYDFIYSNVGWQSRAYMCLLIAEMLEDGTLQINDEGK